MQGERENVLFQSRIVDEQEQCSICLEGYVEGAKTQQCVTCKELYHDDVSGRSLLFERAELAGNVYGMFFLVHRRLAGAQSDVPEVSWQLPRHESVSVALDLKEGMSF